jgi:hypothetical protein
MVRNRYAEEVGQRVPRPAKGYFRAGSLIFEESTSWLTIYYAFYPDFVK